MRTLLDVRREQRTALTVKATPYERIRKLEAAIPLMCDEQLVIEDQTSHNFCDGVYCRKFVLPKDAVVVSKIHAKENWFLLFSGEVSIASHDGTVKRIKAPWLSVTEPGTKRVVYAHEEAVMYTFHGNPDNEQNVDKLEKRYIVPESKPTLSAPEIRMLLEKKQ
jgi:hypothetical protein